jgi:hypothetical protein
MKRKILWLFFIMVTGVSVLNCSYKKGDSYYYIGDGDTTKYIIRKRASGQVILKKIHKQREIHENRKDDYKFFFINDSTEIVGQKTILFSHSEMPDYEEDMLTKGYLGAFGTKEVVTYLIVTVEDIDKYFIHENQD